MSRHLFSHGRRLCFFAVWLLIAALAANGRPGAAAPAATEEPLLELEVRDRQPSAAGNDYEMRLRRVNWPARHTALVVVDMWDRHWCGTASARVAEMAPRMNRFVQEARRRGVFVIHAPSECMKFYADHPARRRAQKTPPAAQFPLDIDKWCHQIPSEEKVRYPLDQSDGGCDMDPSPPSGRAWTRQFPGIEIAEEDAISDSGREVWSMLEERRITHVMVMGVHTNMCVLGRPFGLRNLARNGKEAALVRDMTDTMYSPKSWPFVDHFRGTDLIVEHIEKVVCPTIASNQLLGGAAFHFAADSRPHVALAISESEYGTLETLPRWGARNIESGLGWRMSVLRGEGDHPQRLPNFAATLADADLLVLSMRRRALPAADLEAVRKHLAWGKPLVAIRTSSHAFDARGEHAPGEAEWPAFDREILGGNYQGHHPDGPVSVISAAPRGAGHPILQGVELPLKSQGSLYKTAPLAADAVAILTGEIPAQPAEPVAWTRQVGQARVFYVTLGHASDFQSPGFERLLTNGVAWALNREAIALKKP